MCNPLVAEVMKKTGITSPTKLGEALGVSKQLASSWMKDLSKPDGLNTLKLMELADIERKKALELIQGGFMSLSQMFVTALASTLLIATFYAASHCILC